MANFEEKLTKVEENVVKFNEMQKTAKENIAEKWHSEGGSLRKSLESIDDRVQTIEFHLDKKINIDLDREIQILQNKCMSNQQNIDDVTTTIKSLEDEQIQV